MGCEIRNNSCEDWEGLEAYIVTTGFSAPKLPTTRVQELRHKRESPGPTIYEESASFLSLECPVTKERTSIDVGVLSIRDGASLQLPAVREVSSGCNFIYTAMPAESTEVFFTVYCVINVYI